MVFFNVEVTFPRVAATNPTRRRTLHDVASEIGVSAKTVSNAYRHPDQLSPRLRKRVLATAARIGYAGPDPVASALRRGRVGAIGIAYANQLSYAFEDPVSVQLLAGVTTRASSSETRTTGNSKVNPKIVIIRMIRPRYGIGS